MSEKIWRMRSVLAIRNNTRYHGDAKNANKYSPCCHL